MKNKCIVKQNAETGCFEVVEGVINLNDRFYNGRWHGLHSSYYSNQMPNVHKDVERVVIERSIRLKKGGPYGHDTLEKA